MRFIPHWAPWALSATLLAACGGAGDGDQSPNVHYSVLISFGDSLSDVGTYATQGLVDNTGSRGEYTVNGPGPRNWTELLAKQLGLPAPCAAQTGLNSVPPLAFLAAPTTDRPNCRNYAQGGARVTNPVGPGNVALLPGDTSGVLGQLTDPVRNQITRHLAAVGGTFSGTELVTVLAGGNDALIQSATFSAGATAAATAAVTAAVPGQIQTDIVAGTCIPTDAQATNCQAAAIAELTPTVGATAAAAFAQSNAPLFVGAMGTAGAELADYIKALIVGKGAKHVVVVNLPDLSQTPSGLAQSAQGRAFINQLVNAFNGQLKAGLTGPSGLISGVIIVDAYTQNRDQTAHPAQYQLTNVTDPACNLTDAVNTGPNKTLFSSSLACTEATLVAGDVSHYLYADTVHPTPWGYRLLAQFVTQNMLQAGWL